jgi:methyl-accepting chemotaxis protein
MERAAAEAARGKQYAGEVEQGADRMRGDIDSLRDVLVRIVRLATTEVDRRQSQRHVLDVACTVEIGQGRETGTLHDISAGGAQVAGVADRAAGTRGRLQFSGCARPLPFVVRSCEHQRLHLAFNLDANEAGALAEALVAVAGREAPRAAA